jgi:hypothetical protein
MLDSIGKYLGLNNKQQLCLSPATLVCISDLHSLPLPSLPDGDILIVAGDLCEGHPQQLLTRFAEFTSLSPPVSNTSLSSAVIMTEPFASLAMNEMLSHTTIKTRGLPVETLSAQLPVSYTSKTAALPLRCEVVAGYTYGDLQGH